MAVTDPPRITPVPALPPGPPSLALRQAVGYAWSFPSFTAKQHQRFGPTYTMRLPGFAPAVLTTDRELIRTVLTGDPLVRRHANDILEPAVGSHSVLMLEPAEHLDRRRLLLPPFHGDRVQGYAEVMRRVIHEDLAAWPTDEPVRVHDHARQVTLAVIQSAVLGTRDPDFARELTELLDTFASPIANLALFTPALSQRRRWNLPAEVFHRRRDRLDALMAGQIARIRADPALDTRDDVLALLVRSRDEDGRGLTDEELNDELKALIAAGHETTATAIAWAADLLAHRPDAARRIREGDEAYRAAAAKEVMRLRTVTPVSVARTLLEPTEAGDGVLPAGTVVLVDAFTLHADPALHPEPEAFRPERFLDDGPPAYSYLPFGGGAHRCVGAALATLEMEIALGAIVERFDLEPAGPPERPRRRGPTLIPARGASVRARPRSSSR